MTSKSSTTSPSLHSVGTDAPEENSMYGMRRNVLRNLRGAARGGLDGANARSVMAGVEADMEMDESSVNRLQYTSSTLTNTAFKVLDELRAQKQLCDVIIRVGSSEYVAHRVVLAATCPYFRGMFTS